MLCLENITPTITLLINHINLKYKKHQVFLQCAETKMKFLIPYKKSCNIKTYIFCIDVLKFFEIEI